MLPVGIVLAGGFNGKIIWDFWGGWDGAESRIHVVFERWYRREAS